MTNLGYKINGAITDMIEVATNARVYYPDGTVGVKIERVNLGCKALTLAEMGITYALVNRVIRERKKEDARVKAEYVESRHKYFEQLNKRDEGLMRQLNQIGYDLGMRAY